MNVGKVDNLSSHGAKKILKRNESDAVLTLSFVSILIEATNRLSDFI